MCVLTVMKINLIKDVYACLSQQFNKWSYNIMRSGYAKLSKTMSWEKKKRPLRLKLDQNKQYRLKQN